MRVKKLLSVLGPGIFAIGYTIGTGSVTAMATAGAKYGLQLLWVLFLSCLFSGLLMDAYGRFAVVTGNTSLQGIRKHLPCGKLLAILIFIGVCMGQYTCMGGILTLSSGAIVEMCSLFSLFFPRSPGEYHLIALGVAAAIIAVMFSLMLIGRYSFFEKLLAFFVMLMGLTFLVSMFVVWPDAEVMKRALPPAVPHDAASLLMLASFVGTTMAAPTFVTRPLLLREKNLGVENLGEQRADAVFSASLMFVISGAIMFVATGALFAHGKEIVKVLDMAHTLQPLAGRFAVALFMVGTLSAGLSSIFPIMMVAPLLLSDYQSGKMETKTARFRVLCLIASLFSLLVPALGNNPILITIMAQVSNVFVLPLTILAIFLLLNNRKIMGRYKAGVGTNIGLIFAFLFACAVAYTGYKALALTITRGL
ncbi:MAG: Nramp family divalent metal transporter [Kiritimatiellae bacterium]|nr:Nramp family divalent metal transporter [Kiritimatiellia bacterium]